MLNESSYVLPFNSKVKINELKVSTNKGYCNKFQIGKCTFGNKCRYRHEIDPDYKKKEEVVVGKNNKDFSKDRNKNKDKNNDRKPSKDRRKPYHLITIIIVLSVLLRVKFQKDNHLDILINNKKFLNYLLNITMIY